MHHLIRRRLSGERLRDLLQPASIRHSYYDLHVQHIEFSILTRTRFRNDEALPANSRTITGSSNLAIDRPSSQWWRTGVESCRRRRPIKALRMRPLSCSPKCGTRNAGTLKKNVMCSLLACHAQWLFVYYLPGWILCS